MQQITIQGISIDDFLTKVEEASYNGQKRAIEEEKTSIGGVDWSKYKALMCVDDLCDIFPIKKRTAMNWITEKSRFGDYSNSGKLLLVPKVAVKKYYETTLVKSRR